MQTITLKLGRERSVQARHPWIFSGAVLEFPDNVDQGALVRIENSRGEFLAIGYYNRESSIAIRIISFEETPIDRDFFIQRFQALRALKERFVSQIISDSYRVVFAESDGLPGLIVDKYAATLVLQAHTLGIDLLKPLIVEALVSVFKPDTIYERSEVSVRKLEGLETRPQGVLFGTPPNLIKIHENNCHFFVDVVNGQKTGFFLDQRDNRAALARYVNTGARALNIFSYTGAFGVALRQAGAASVVNLDRSESALILAEKNYALNNIIPTREDEFLLADAFEYLEDRTEETPAFDFIVLDPPAFAKSRTEAGVALKAYTRINRLVLKILKSGGILATSSCSNVITEEDFLKAIARAATQTRTNLRLLEARSAPPDHSFAVNFPEGRYLKFLIFVKE